MTQSFDYVNNPNNDLKTFHLSSGTWLFRIWGAQGGYVKNSQGGHGAYSEAVYKTEKDVTLYYFVGKQGFCSFSNEKIFKKFSGGNNMIGLDRSQSCTGGEATFISEDINAMKILLISGAGGGAGYWKKVSQNIDREFLGGFGGPFAEDSNGDADWMSEENSNLIRGKGATYNRPGEGGFYGGYEDYISVKATPGSYLKGGDGNASAGGSSGGGGSGFYGGGGGTDVAGGGGGSSFASFDMYNVILLGGNKPFLSPSNSIEYGHSGNGYIRIEPTKPYTLDKQKCPDCSLRCNINFQYSFFILFSLSLQFLSLGLF